MASKPVIFLLVLVCLLLITLIGLYVSGFFSPKTIVYNNNYYTTPDNGGEIARMTTPPTSSLMTSGEELVGKSIKTGGAKATWSALPFTNGATKGEMVSLYASQGYAVTGKIRYHTKDVDSLEHGSVISNKGLYDESKKCYKIAVFSGRFPFIPCPKIYTSTWDMSNDGNTRGFRGTEETKEKQLEKFTIPRQAGMVLEAAIAPGDATKRFHDLYFGFVFNARVFEHWVRGVLTTSLPIDINGNLTKFARGESLERFIRGDVPITDLQQHVVYGPGSDKEDVYVKRSGEDVAALADAFVKIGNDVIPTLHQFVFINTTGKTVADTIISTAKKHTPKKHKTFGEFVMTPSSEVHLAKFLNDFTTSMPDVKSGQQAFLAIPDAKLLQIRRLLQNSFPVLAMLDDTMYKVLHTLSQGDCAVCAFSENLIVRNISKSMATDLFLLFLVFVSVFLAVVKGLELTPLVLGFLTLITPPTPQPPPENQPPIYPQPPPETQPPIEPDSGDKPAAKVRALVMRPASQDIIQTARTYAFKARSFLYNN